MTSTNIQNLHKVMLPIIRQVMPTLIAQSIVGVQPMSGTTANIFTMKTRYTTITGNYKIYLKKGHNRVFLRLYDRRKFTTHDDISTANYPWVELKEYDKVVPARTWCEDQFGKCGFIFDEWYNRFYFENKEDCAMFTLTWL